MAEWTAYCAPGRRAYATILLALKGDDVREVKETSVLEGGTVVLVNDAAIEEAFKLDRRLELSTPRPAPDWLLSWSIGGMVAQAAPLVIP